MEREAYWRGGYWKWALIEKGGLLERGLIGNRVLLERGSYWKGEFIRKGGLLERGAYWSFYGRK